MALVSLEGELGLLVSKVSLLGGPCPQRSEGCADRDQAVPLNCSHRIAWMDSSKNKATATATAMHAPTHKSTQPNPSKTEGRENKTKGKKRKKTKMTKRTTTERQQGSARTGNRGQRPLPTAERSALAQLIQRPRLRPIPLLLHGLPTARHPPLGTPLPGAQQPPLMRSAQPDLLRVGDTHRLHSCEPVLVERRPAAQQPPSIPHAAAAAGDASAEHPRDDVRFEGYERPLQRRFSAQRRGHRTIKCRALGPGCFLPS